MKVYLAGGMKSGVGEDGGMNLNTKYYADVAVDELVAKSRSIYEDAKAQYDPQATIMAMSGGGDSMAAYQVAKLVGVKLDAILHVNTGTGIKETSAFVKDFAASEGLRFIEAHAGKAYENYVIRKGFAGRGRTAHTYMYHMLKAGPLRKAISKHFRQGRRDYKVLLINGARASESDNRMLNITSTTNVDSGADNNVWTSIIHHWDKRDINALKRALGYETNPVSDLLHRSGECMCGTMQNVDDRKLASQLYPEWGKWLDQLEERVTEKMKAKHRGLYWLWGEDVPKQLTEIKAGQLPMFDFSPMCVSCVHRGDDAA